MDLGPSSDSDEEDTLENQETQQLPALYTHVAVYPSQLYFYLDEEGGDTQVLTLYNVNNHPVQFVLMSNAPRRYSVTGRSGIITPHCYAKIEVQHCDLSKENVGIKDKLRVVMRIQGSQTQALKDVPAILLGSPSRSDDDEESEDEEDAYQMDSTLPEPSAPLPEQDQGKGWFTYVRHLSVLFGFLACVGVLMAPTEDARDASGRPLLEHLPVRRGHQLLAIYILGVMTTLLFRW